MEVDWQKIKIKELVAIISEHLSKNGIEVVLVGGTCVSLYSENNYKSYDIDLITHVPLKKITPILKTLGFESLARGGKLFENPKCDFLIDFVAPPVAIGDEPVHELNNIKTSLGSFNLLTPYDCVRDRLCAYFYYNDLQCLNQAVMVAKRNKVNFSEIKRWAETLGEMELEKYRIFKKEYNKKEV